jgi:hypothetical protein
MLDVNINRGGNQYYAFKRQQRIVVSVWSNFTSDSAPIIVSAYDVPASAHFHLL